MSRDRYRSVRDAVTVFEVVSTLDTAGKHNHAPAKARLSFKDGRL